MPPSAAAPPGDAVGAGALYRRAADEAAAGAVPDWAAVIARARLIDLDAAAGDFAGAAGQWFALASLRPARCEAFLPDTFGCPDPEAYDDAVRRVHRELFASLTGGRDAAPARAMLDRLRFTLPDDPDPRGPFGRRSARGGSVVWLLDLASIPTPARAEVVSRLAGAIWRLSRSADHRFAVVAGTDPERTFPVGGGTASTAFADKQAAERFLQGLAASDDRPPAPSAVAAKYPGAALVVLSGRFQ